MSHYSGSFSQAFGNAHSDLGAGSTFSWTNKDGITREYHTNRADGRDLRAERLAREATTTNSSYNDFYGSNGNDFNNYSSYTNSHDSWHDSWRERERESEALRKRERILREREERVRIERERREREREERAERERIERERIERERSWAFGKANGRNSTGIGGRLPDTGALVCRYDGCIRTAARRFYCARAWGLMRKQMEEAHFQTLNKLANTITFDCEGNDNKSSIYYSRVPHHPSHGSGVTIGRGYDMKGRTQAKIKQDLTLLCGVPEETAKVLMKAAGLSGAQAQAWVNKKENKVEITYEQQRELFKLAYDEIVDTVLRINNKADVVKAYGRVDWRNTNDAIKEVVIDLFFRGDSTGRQRREYHKYVVNNDVRGLLRVIKNRDLWPKNLDDNRYEKRVRRLEKELKRLKKG